jgi:penicillin amidase
MGAVTVTRDDWGIPHVVGRTVADVAFAQGRAAAEDRAWQIEYSRLRAEGRTASVLGPSGLDWDRFARRVQLDRLGLRAYDVLSPESTDFLVSFVIGVNEGLARASAPELDELGIRPGEWQPWTPLSVFATLHVLFGTFPDKLWRDQVAEVAGREMVDVLASEGLLASGSNSWVVGGGRTASSLPMIGGDPHRTFESPNCYQQVRLTCTDRDDSFDVVGFTFPGVPGVQHFAHAGSVAWGITNAMGDYQDVYVERLQHTNGELSVDTPDGWIPITVQTEVIEVRGAAPEEVEVLETPNGFVFWRELDPVSKEPGDDRWIEQALALRTSAHVLGDLGFDCLLPLLRSRTTADVMTALQRWVEPVNNLVVADVHGDVRQQVVGRLPMRADENRWGVVRGWSADHDWQGWLDNLPGETLAADGHLVTANHRMNPGFDRVGVEFASPARARRIDALLAGRSALTPENFAEIHGDTLAGQPAALADALAALTALSPQAATLRDEISAWDQHFDADSTTAAAYADIRDAFVGRLIDGPLKALADSVAEGSPAGSIFDYWFSMLLRVQLSLANLLSETGRAVVPGIDAVLADAVEDVAGRPRRRWGDRHRFQPYHALGHDIDDEPGLAGDNDCVRCAGAFGTDIAVRGSVARYVWDLAGVGTSGWIVPLGASGDPRSPHHRDQLPLWVAGSLARPDGSK